MSAYRGLFSELKRLRKKGDDHCSKILLRIEVPLNPATVMSPSPPPEPTAEHPILASCLRTLCAGWKSLRTHSSWLAKRGNRDCSRPIIHRKAGTSCFPGHIASIPVHFWLLAGAENRITQRCLQPITNSAPPSTRVGNVSSTPTNPGGAPVATA